MAHVYIEEIGKHEGEAVTIKGWLQNRRSSGKIHFLIVHVRNAARNPCTVISLRLISLSISSIVMFDIGSLRVRPGKT